MNIQKHIDYWINSAEHDSETAEVLFTNGHYDWCLFIGHLMIEKILKAGYVKIIKISPPKTHNLVFLADKIKLPINKEQESFLFQANAFNIEARYGDYKSEFYKKCTKEFASENFTKIKEIYKWIKSQI